MTPEKIGGLATAATVGGVLEAQLGGKWRVPRSVPSLYRAARPPALCGPPPRVPVFGDSSHGVNGIIQSVGMATRRRTSRPFRAHVEPIRPGSNATKCLVTA